MSIISIIEHTSCASSPVYSRDSRCKLVYRVRFAAACGQPLGVRKGLEPRTVLPAEIDLCANHYV